MRANAWVTTSWDDGSPEDVRLSALLGKYGIPGTFYIPLANRERDVLTPENIVKISECFEIGGHTRSHAALTTLAEDLVEREVLAGKEELESLVRRPLVCFSYPYGRVNEAAKSIVASTGFSYARTVRLFGTRIGDRLAAPTTIQVHSHSLAVYLKHGMGQRLFYSLIRNRKFSLNWESLAIASLHWCLEHGGIFHLWGHSWEVEEQGDWDRLERVLAYLARRTYEYQRKTNGELLNLIGSPSAQKGRRAPSS